MANKHSNTPLYVIIALLTVILLGGGAFLLTQGKTEVKGTTQVTDVTPKTVVNEPAQSQAIEESTVKTSVSEDKTPMAETTTRKSNPGSLHTYMIGTIGDGQVNFFSVDGLLGSYSYVSNGVQSGKRSLSTDSYDPDTGRLILRAYAGSKYIGTFNGIYHHNVEYSSGEAVNTSDSYEGTFEGVQGAIIKFSLYSD